MGKHVCRGYTDAQVGLAWESFRLAAASSAAAGCCVPRPARSCAWDEPEREVPGSIGTTTFVKKPTQDRDRPRGTLTRSEDSLRASFSAEDSSEALVQRATASRVVLFTELVPSPLASPVHSATTTFAGSLPPAVPRQRDGHGNVIKITTVLEARGRRATWMKQDAVTSPEDSTEFADLKRKIHVGQESSLEEDEIPQIGSSILRFPARL
ncbi:hypothetical protein KM043_008566 [Ampulex compressa]|nr:hypothetical protein KM043_008566 [Ampulex compressa]